MTKEFTLEIGGTLTVLIGGEPFTKVEIVAIEGQKVRVRFFAPTDLGIDQGIMIDVMTKPEPEKKPRKKGANGGLKRK